MIILSVRTQNRIDFVEISDSVQKEVSKTGIKDAVVTLYVPHTTCGITINEHADPAVAEDIKHQLTELVPYQAGYRHSEGNADSHIKTSIVGSSETVIVERGKLVLGTWQGIFLADFDGPRTRKVYLKIIEG
ncbi:MAG: secondary thiamine-phosphate synthase enzyme YjbQ [Candidatus Neomarinimicrobiota bacterium]